MPYQASGPVPPHRMNANHKEWTPPAFLTFDSETRWRDDGDDQTHTLRLWAARLTVRRDTAGVPGDVLTAAGTTGGQLAAQIGEWFRGRKCIWGFAHNLGFDLVITNLIPELLHDGWTISRSSLSADAPWIGLRRGRHTLTLCDSLSHWRIPLEQLGQLAGEPKAPMPAQEAPDTEWAEYCAQDCRVLSVALRQYMDYWDAHHMGHWGLTGSANGGHHMAHLCANELPFIDHDNGASQHDRKAVYGGMRGAQEHGRLPGGRYVELDFRRAYTVIPARLPMPVGRAGTFYSLPVDHEAIDSPELGIIAQVELDTDTPRYPVRTGEQITYPTGRITTVLASPEIAEARLLGHLVSIGPGQFHRLSKWSAPWAQACLELSSGHPSRVPPVVAAAAKHHGRAVPGRFAQHGWRVVDGWETPGVDFRKELYIDMATGKAGSVITLGGKSTAEIPDGDGDNAYPAYLAFDESHVRLRLNRVMDAIGRRHVVQWDTDGVIARYEKGRTFSRQHPITAPLELREKNTITGLTIAGPQMISGDGYKKTSGIPRKAEPTPDGGWTGQIWPSLDTGMTTDTEGEYHVKTVTFGPPGLSVMGWALTDGTVEPPTAYIGSCGATHLRGPSSEGYSPRGYKLAERQSAAFLQIVAAMAGTEDKCAQPDGRDQPSPAWGEPAGHWHASREFDRLRRGQLAAIAQEAAERGETVSMRAESWPLGQDAPAASANTIPQHRNPSARKRIPRIKRRRGR